MVHQDTFVVAEGIAGIDTRMVGSYLVTSAYLLDGPEPALIETGPTTSASAVIDGLRLLNMGPDDLAHVIVTHIHLDHAGGVGTLTRSFPRATIWVHERGAPHLADPTRLVASTERAYGAERMREWFGVVEPTPKERLRSVSDGDVIRLGPRSLDVLYTPGHASHHVALVDSETGGVFTGDAIGVHLPDVKVLRPATPPPEFDVDRAIDSIERIRGKARSMLLLSHFGAVPHIDAVCDLAIARIRSWAEVVRAGLERGDDLDRIVDLLEQRGADEYEADSGEPIDRERYDILASIRMNAEGLTRYWRKRWEKDADETGARVTARPGSGPRGA